jgi:hypothetical protein
MARLCAARSATTTASLEVPCGKIEIRREEFRVER